MSNIIAKEKYSSTSHILLQDEDSSRWAKSQSKGTKKDGYSQLDEGDETDTQDEGVFSVVAIGEQNKIPVKAPTSSNNMSAKSKRRFGARRSRSPIAFAPRSPKNFRRFIVRRSRSADSDTFWRQHTDAGGDDDVSFPPPQPLSQRSSFASRSSKDPSKPDLLSQSLDTIMGSHHSESTTETYQTSFSSPFVSSRKLAPFRPSGICDNAPVEKQHNEVGRSIRKNSDDETYQPISNGIRRRQNSLKLMDVFPSVFEDAHRPFDSMPESNRTHFHPSQTFMGRIDVGNNKSFAKAMELDPFEDDCVEFSSEHCNVIEMTVKESPEGSRAEYPRSCTIKRAEMPKSDFDFARQLKVMQARHEKTINEMRNEIENRDEIIKSMTKQVQDLMSRNEELSRQHSKQQNRASKFKKKESKHSIHRMTHIDMSGQDIESPCGNPSLQSKYVVVEASEIQLTDLCDEVMEEKRQEKLKSSKREKSPKKGDLDLDHVASTSFEDEEMDLSPEVPLKSKKGKRQFTTEKTQKKRKGKRSSKLSNSCGQSEPANEHPLSMRKKRISAEFLSKKSTSSSISESAKGGKNSKNESSQKLSGETGNIWLSDWDDPSTLERKRDSKAQKHSSKNLQKLKENSEASLEKSMPKRKAKRKSARVSTKSKIEMMADPHNEDSTKKSKRSSRKSRGSMPISSDHSDKTKKTKKTKLLDPIQS